MVGCVCGARRLSDVFYAPTQTTRISAVLFVLAPFTPLGVYAYVWFSAVFVHSDSPHKTADTFARLFTVTFVFPFMIGCCVVAVASQIMLHREVDEIMRRATDEVGRARVSTSSHRRATARALRRARATMYDTSSTDSSDADEPHGLVRADSDASIAGP